MMYIFDAEDVKGCPRGVKTTLDTTTVNIGPGRERQYRLVHTTPGLELAGSRVRYRQSQAWGVLFDLDGAVHGQWFTSLEKAIVRYEIWSERDA